MKVSGCGLVVTPETRPMQSPDLLLLRFRERVQEATYLWHTQRDALVRSCAFFSCASACLRSTTSAA
jgi:hypothetical protein